MPAERKQFEALKNSSNHLNNLKIQLKQAQERHANLLRQVLATAGKNPSQWEFKIIEQKETIAKGPLNKQSQAILAAVAGSVALIPPGEGAGCPERVGCANIGQLGDKCFYLCQTVTFHHTDS